MCWMHYWQHTHTHTYMHKDVQCTHFASVSRSLYFTKISGKWETDLKCFKLKLAKFFHCTIIKPFLNTLQLFCHTERSPSFRFCTMLLSTNMRVCVYVFICQAQRLNCSTISWIKLCGTKRVQKLTENSLIILFLDLLIFEIIAWFY